MAMERLIYNVVLCYCVSSLLITQSSAAVGADCTANPTTVCIDADGEVCETNICVCKTGFINNAGTCADIDECATNPCKNGGSCANGVNEYTCTCAAGWTGTTCETDIDECTAGRDDCDDTNAECGNTDGSFTCTCNSGFAGDGKTCTDIDECASNPCKNGGTCDNQMNEYMCDCAAGWTGTTCETATVGVCTGETLACPDTVDNGECSGTACVCKDGYKKEEDNCVFVPDNAAGKTTMAAVTMVMAVLTIILIHMF